MVEIVAGPTIGIGPQMRHCATPVNYVGIGDIAAFRHWDGLVYRDKPAIAVEENVRDVAVRLSSRINDLPLLAHLRTFHMGAAVDARSRIGLTVDRDHAIHRCLVDKPGSGNFPAFLCPIRNGESHILFT
jgi:hypothetical protein